MPQLRIALAQVNPTVGDLAGNTALVREWSGRAAGAGARLVAFPELMITGYPVEDLVFREAFVAASRAALTRLATDLDADGLGELAVVVGYLDADGPARLNADAAPGAGPRNALAVLHRGQVACRYYKHHLPNYGVFDEDRYFVAGDTLAVVRLGAGTAKAATPPVEAAGSASGEAAGTAPGERPGGAPAPADAVDVALTICEDIWQAGGPFAAARSAGAGLVVNINASPYELNKDDVRLPLIARRAAEAGATVAYVNMVGGQDELVFDGDSMIVAADGRLLARAPQFVERLLIHDLDLPAVSAGAPGAATTVPAPPGTAPAPLGAATTAPAPAVAATDPLPPAGMAVERVAVPVALAVPAGEPARGGIAEPLPAEAEVWHALVLGLRDYVHKNRFGSVVIALSGGIDSTVVAAIAVDALGPHHVVGVSMPSQHSSAHSREDAADLAKRLGLDYRIEPIQPMVDAFLANLSLSGVAVENLQARVRGVILMALSNQEGHLVLTTGNKSELAVGYSTLYGDSVGGFNPLKDVPKVLVWRLARWRNQAARDRGEQPPIPDNSIDKPPSAELSPGQLDSDTLPPYDELDPIIAGYVDGDLGRDQLVEAGHDPATVDRILRMIDLAEYKRRQSAPGTKISIKAFGRDRRLPITNRYRGV